MNEAKEGKRCNAVITSKGLKNGGICHQFVLKVQLSVKHIKIIVMGFVVLRNRDGSACPNRAIKNGLCGTTFKRRKRMLMISRKRMQKKKLRQLKIKKDSL